MTRAEAIRRMVEIISTQDIITEAEEIANEYNICLSEVWSDDEEEIIGMMVEDITIYF